MVAMDDDDAGRTDAALRDRRMAGRAACLTALRATGVLLLLAIAMFTVAPWIDLKVSGLFTSTAASFPAQNLPLWQNVRMAMFASTDGLMLAVLVWTLVAWRYSALRLVRQRILCTALAAYAIVPGVIVNWGLKSHWGRARPRDVVEFGGAAHFTPPLQIADQCRANCSFVSGEASALFTVGTLLMLIVVPLLPARLRVGAAVAIGLVAVSGSALRVAFGGHFASDVIFAALVSTAITLAIYMIAGLDRIGDPFAQSSPRPSAPASSTLP